ncbi:hypothetical protein [Chitinophaga pinensis]|uniref:Uncharacterized protein n=1 Tax=Chitinophaga pinensis (strain ATCC 43595 / DSM 2588 / LMG 13176 / NBRC 15968 / NCIMB 11800 / UQM 2034) TaxID=485918 RepID=A0A979G8A6_CHIPD|nr:hypothetical protein [Chitinophaga pinensis]ACU62492.1 hypothetical protein Cpin_5060 [Chitinophaga pinensis DSM 2588]
MDTQHSSTGKAPGIIDVTPPSEATIKTQSIRLIATGIMGQFATMSPLVSLRKSADFYNCYDVRMHIYLPDQSRNLKLGEDISQAGTIDIENGPIEVREIDVIYDNPEIKPEIYAYSLWDISFRYCVEGRELPAIRVRYVIDDPETTHGTVTSVEKT